MSHLTREQRDYIDNALKNRQSFKAIAWHLGVARSTVKREVCRHAEDSDKGRQFTAR